ncbi:MAG: hypothetical protein LBB76_05700 [Azoarcus sp.]|jgi:hypothetical protein|nr:hypothetical protein [Azoarcus sp.]
MRSLFFLAMMSLLSSAPVGAQETAAGPAQADEQTSAGQTSASQTPTKDDWRDISGYPYPALAVTVAAMQNLAYAMTLRDYCADLRVPAEFVRERLARFSRMTGREEDCKSLLDY